MIPKSNRKGLRFFVSCPRRLVREGQGVTIAHTGKKPVKRKHALGVGLLPDLTVISETYNNRLTGAPLVSVAMLTYNHAPHIRESIESVVNQVTSFPFELIIGDDCSTDGTREITLEYQAKYPEKVRVITADKNVGGRDNLRRIEQACRGRYVAYCEGDDYWHDLQKLEQQVTFLELHKDYSLVHSDYRVLDVESGKIVKRAIGPVNGLDDGFAYDEIISGHRWVLTLTACARRSVLSAILDECEEVYSSKFLMCDTQRWLELARRGKVKYLPIATATHKVLRESASQSQNPINRLRFAISAKEVLDHYIEKYGCSSYAKSENVRSVVNVLRCSYEARDFPVAKEMFDQYRKTRVRREALPFLYYVGSWSPWHQRLVRPLVDAACLINKIAGRIEQLVKKPAESKIIRRLTC
jgi:glycosyltransferase involved in cell wall biosynthesis